jgi:hypothetical protein
MQGARRHGAGYQNMRGDGCRRAHRRQHIWRQRRQGAEVEQSKLVIQAHFRLHRGTGKLGNSSNSEAGSSRETTQRALLRPRPAITPTEPPNHCGSRDGGEASSRAKPDPAGAIPDPERSAPNRDGRIRRPGLRPRRRPTTFSCSHRVHRTGFHEPLQGQGGANQREGG